MIKDIFLQLESFEDLLWGYAGVPLLVLVGLYFTIQSNFFQFRALPLALKKFYTLLTSPTEKGPGVHPLKAFFASVGGCVGIGNLAGVCVAIQIGGPGALFWLWVTAFIGMILKYCEVFLGLKFRVKNNQNSYNGGPTFFLRHAFKNTWIAQLAGIMLCIYGVEIWQFSIVVESITTNWYSNYPVVVFTLLALVLYAGVGGIQRVGSIASTVIPIFVVLYLGMGFFVLANHIEVIPGLLKEVFTSAFSGSAAVGGFLGSSFIMTLSQGVRRGCYTGDLGIGYASIIHSESSATIPQQQALLAIVDIFLDTVLICSTSALLALSTGLWSSGVSASLMIQTALSQHIPYMHFFMPFFIFLLGYSTINAFLCVGIKCAEQFSPKHGRKMYILYAAIALPFFSMVGVQEAYTIMAITGGSLLIINSIGMFRLRKEISFEIEEVKEEEVVSELIKT